MIENMTPLVVVNAMFILMALMWYFAGVLDEGGYNEPVFMFLAKISVVAAILANLFHYYIM